MNCSNRMIIEEDFQSLNNKQIIYNEAIPQPKQYHITMTPKINLESDDQEKNNSQNYQLFNYLINSDVVVNTILNFFDIESLNNFANVNKKLRITVKNYFQTVSFRPQIKVFDAMKKSALFETIQSYLKLKIKFIYSSKTNNEHLTQQTQNLKQQTHLKQLEILFYQLSESGVTLGGLDEVIPFIKERGVSKCFPDAFKLYNCDFTSNPSHTVDEFKYASDLSQELNVLLLLMQQKSTIQRFFKFDEEKEPDLTRQISRYIHWKGIEGIRPIIVKRIESSKFQKEKNIYQYLNKNSLSQILPFLNTIDILNLKKTSQQFNILISLTLENHISYLLKQRLQKSIQLNLDFSLVIEAELFAHYCVLQSMVQDTISMEVILISNLQCLVQFLNYLSDENQKYIDLGQTYNWQYILEQTEAVKAQFITSFIPNSSNIHSSLSNEQNKQDKQIAQTPQDIIEFYQDDSDEYGILNQGLKELNYQIKRNLDIDPSFRQNFSYYLDHFYHLNKTIYILQKIQNKDIQIPPIYTSSIYDNFIACYSYQYKWEDPNYYAVNQEDYNFNDEAVEQQNNLLHFQVNWADVNEQENEESQEENGEDQMNNEENQQEERKNENEGEGIKDENGKQNEKIIRNEDENNDKSEQIEEEKLWDQKNNGEININEVQ